MFAKILIANRGEIACRVIRTARRMGIKTVAVYSDADANSQHVLQADEAYHIGGSAPADSYLRGDVILDVAKRSGAQAIHPGYGFLSENAAFASAVEDAGLTFIGPRAESMIKMGSKAGAKDLMAAAGVPVVPGYTGENQDPAYLLEQADLVGYPLMIKAAHGGGGKGMRIVRSRDEFLANLESCQREALNAFGRDRVLLKRFIETPRHIEIQIFGDSHGNVMHLFERECSAQRRYQKVIEESPSPFLTPERREAMGAAAVLAGKAIDYINAGTVEFIVGADGQFYFMEINTRLQVEHPVTELVTGLDLVEWQLRIADGEALPCATSDLRQNGHAIEVRIYAEDPSENFLPSSGRLNVLRLPRADAHVRIDSGVVEGDTVSIFYDPMIAKLIVHDVDRPSALQRLREALASSEVMGLKTNIEFLEQLIRHPSVVNATIDTSYLDRHLDEVIPVPSLPPAWVSDAAALVQLHGLPVTPSVQDPTSPWNLTDSWRLGHAKARPVSLKYGEERLDVEIASEGSSAVVHDGADSRSLSGLNVSSDAISFVVDGQRRKLDIVSVTPRTILHDGTQRYIYQAINRFEADGDDAGATSDQVTAPMPGRIVVIKSSEGDAVVAGQEVMVIEAMKMELSLKAPRDGVIASITATPGEFVEADTVLLKLATDA